MKWLVTGAGGQLGSLLHAALQQRGTAVTGLLSPTGPAPASGQLRRIDLQDAEALKQLVDALRPTHIVHTAAVSSPALAFAEPELAWSVNVEASASLAAAARRVGARFVFTSSDMVFDGYSAPYDEQREPTPRTVYGETKAAAEAQTLREGGVVVRCPLLYGIAAVRRNNFFVHQMRTLREGAPLTLFHDEYRTPLWLSDAAQALAQVALSELQGVVHIGGPERLSRLQMGQQLATAMGVDEPHLVLRSCRDVEGAEPRAPDLSLGSTRFAEHFGQAPGRTMAEALKIILAGEPRA